MAKDTAVQTQETPLDQEFLTRMRDRVTEIAPLVEEHQRLAATIAAVEQVQNGAVETPAQTKPPARRPGRPARQNGEAPKSGTRADQVLSVVKENPGITVSEVGTRMGLKQKNYIYRVAAELQESGLVRKEGTGLVAV